MADAKNFVIIPSSVELEQDKEGIVNNFFIHLQAPLTVSPGDRIDVGFIGADRAVGTVAGLSCEVIDDTIIKCEVVAISSDATGLFDVIIKNYNMTQKKAFNVKRT